MSQSDIPRLLAGLKTILRARQITYRDIAAHLGVHEATIKRQLNGGTLSLATLERIGKLAGVRLIDLMEAATEPAGPVSSTISPGQEAALLANMFRAFLFYLLQCGWTAAGIRNEFGLSESDLVSHLTKLDRLGLIRLLPNNRVRVLVARRPQWAEHGLARTAIDHWTATQFGEAQLAEIGNYEVETVKVSPASLAQLRAMARDLADVATEASARDRSASNAPTTWHSLLVAIRPADPTAIPDKNAT